MGRSRRDLLSAGAQAGAFTLGIAAGLISAPRRARAQADGWNKPAFSAKDLGSAGRALGSGKPVQSDLIELGAPDIAEDGAAVQVSVSSKLPGTEQVAILVEGNPAPLAAVFSFSESNGVEIVTRIKMAGSSDVYALVKAGGAWYFTRASVKVTLGGCGA